MRQGSGRRLGAPALLGLLASACFNPPAAEVMFACDPAGDDACPAGYACGADGCCRREGVEIEGGGGECKLAAGSGGPTGGPPTGGPTTGATSTGASTGASSGGPSTGAASTGATSTGGTAGSSGPGGSSGSSTGASSTGAAQD